MNQVRATVQAGVCGFVTEIIARADDDRQVQFTIASPCTNIQTLAATLPAEIDIRHTNNYYSTWYFNELLYNNQAVTRTQHHDEMR